MDYKKYQWNCLVSVEGYGLAIDRSIQTLNLDDFELMISNGIAKDNKILYNLQNFLEREFALIDNPLFVFSFYDGVNEEVQECIDFFCAKIKDINKTAGLLIFSSSAIRWHGDYYHQHVPSQTYSEFEKKIARHLEKMVECQPASSPLNIQKSVFPKLYLETSCLDDFELIFDKPFLLKVMVEGVSFEFFCNFRSPSKRLIIFGQDAITRSKINLPYFFRWRWLESINESVIILNDPTLYLDDGLNGGWFIGEKNRDYVHECADIINKIVKKIASDPPTFFGVSAGGFSSLALASCIEGAKAVVEIPQIDLATYHQKKEIERLVAAAFGVSSIQKVPEDLIYRINIIERFKHENRIPDILYQQNINDEVHFSQFQYFLKEWAGISHVIPHDKVGVLNVITYDRWSLSKGGHFPLQKKIAIERILNF